MGAESRTKRAKLARCSCQKAKTASGGVVEIQPMEGTTSVGRGIGALMGEVLFYRMGNMF